MIKKIVIIIIVLIILAAIYNLFNQIIQSAKSGDRLSEAAEKVYRLEIKNKELKQQLQKIQTPEFIEEVVRNKLGLSKKGETIVVIPEEKLKLVLGIATPSAQIKLPNWLGWIKVFFK